jgi:hypothetical protein
MQTKFEYSAGGTNNAAKIPHQVSLLIKQRENISTAKRTPQKQPQHKDTAVCQTKRKDKPKQLQNKFGTNSIINPNTS